MFLSAAPRLTKRDAAALRAHARRLDVERARRQAAAAQKQIKMLRAARSRRVAKLRADCHLARLALSAAIKARRQAERDQAKAERAAARTACSARLTLAKETASRHIRRTARAAQEARQAERDASRAPALAKPRSTARERAMEAEEATLRDIETASPDLVPLWHRVKRHIRATDRMSRAEAFFHYVHEHPTAALDAIDDQVSRELRKLQKDQKALAKAARSPKPLKKPTAMDVARRALDATATPDGTVDLVAARKKSRLPDDAFDGLMRELVSIGALAHLDTDTSLARYLEAVPF